MAASSQQSTLSDEEAEPETPEFEQLRRKCADQLEELRLRAARRCNTNAAAY
jgi:hypothetical protein